MEVIRRDWEYEAVNRIGNATTIVRQNVGKWIFIAECD
jgi:hypothetical protein